MTGEDGRREREPRAPHDCGLRRDVARGVEDPRRRTEGCRTPADGERTGRSTREGHPQDDVGDRAAPGPLAEPLPTRSHRQRDGLHDGLALRCDARPADCLSTGRGSTLSRAACVARSPRSTPILTLADACARADEATAANGTRQRPIRPLLRTQHPTSRTKHDRLTWPCLVRVSRDRAMTRAPCRDRHRTDPRARSRPRKPLPRRARPATVQLGSV